jgi:hypothetical protein
MKRFLLFFLLMLLTLLQAGLINHIGRFAPNAALVCLLLLAFFMPVSEVAWLALWAGFLGEFFSSFPFGIFLLSLLATIFVCLLLRQNVLVKRQRISALFMVCAGTLLFPVFHLAFIQLFHAVGLYPFSFGSLWPRLYPAALWTVVMNAALAGVLFLLRPHLFEIKIDA